MMTKAQFVTVVFSLAFCVLGAAFFFAGHRERQEAIAWGEGFDARITKAQADLEQLKAECLNLLP